MQLLHTRSRPSEISKVVLEPLQKHSGSLSQTMKLASGSDSRGRAGSPDLRAHSDLRDDLRQILIIKGWLSALSLQ